MPPSVVAPTFANTASEITSVATGVLQFYLDMISKPENVAVFGMFFVVAVCFAVGSNPFRGFLKMINVMDQSGRYSVRYRVGRAGGRDHYRRLDVSGTSGVMSGTYRESRNAHS